MITVATTLTDPDVYSNKHRRVVRLSLECGTGYPLHQAVAESLPCAVQSPEMIHRELWTTLLSHNLIRTTAAAAALLGDGP